MNVKDLLLDQLKEAHQTVESTMEGVDNEVAHFSPPGKANPIAGTYAHLVFSEDFFIHGLLQNKKPLFETEFEGKTGASEVQPTEWETAYPKWLREVTIDVPTIQEYAQSVYKASEEYIASLQDADFEREVDMSMFGMGARTVASVLSGIIIAHCRDINGEISVLKGIQGLKGYPF
jgi:hypothetical protein